MSFVLSIRLANCTLLWLLLTLVACNKEMPKQIAEVRPSDVIKIDMYKAAIDARFVGNSWSLISQPVVYLQPTFYGTEGDPVPAPILNYLEARLGRLGFQRVFAEHPGGLVVGLSAPDSDLHAYGRAGREGTSLFISTYIGETICTVENVGYLLNRTEEAWQAEAFMTAIC